MDYENTAKKILQRVGGKDNVINLVHCLVLKRLCGFQCLLCL